MILPLPTEPARERLQAFIERHLPEIRTVEIPPCRHPEVTLLMYWFPKADVNGERSTQACEFALRKTLTVLGRLPTVIVTDRAWPALTAVAEALGAEIQEEATLIPGDIWTLSRDCIERLHTRFATRHVLTVQNDGWALKDDLDSFLTYDYVGAPNVRTGWREVVADWLGLTILNGGFSLRSQRLCAAVAQRWRQRWQKRLKAGDKAMTEDIFYTKTLRTSDWGYRRRFRFAPSTIARRFSVDCLNCALPIPLGANPMGFHGPQTLRAVTDETAPLTVVSVVRDLEMYERCVRQNPHLAGARFVMFDNREENRPIPERYNAFLDTMPSDTEWILFAHEDFELREDPRPMLARHHPLFLQGHIGTRRVMGTVVFPSGSLSDSHRDGSDPQRLCPPWWIQKITAGLVECFDCCGFYVHVDALKTWKLRFDEQCKWDLYAEDLCCQMMRTAIHLPRILPVKAHHWSRGNPHSERFLATKAYLDHKYADTFFAGGTCTFTLGGRPPLRFRFYRRLVRTLLFWRFQHD